MVSAATLETDKEPDLYNDNDIEPDFHPILAATVNPVAMNEQESKEHFSDEEEIVQTPPGDPDSQPETNPSTGLTYCTFCNTPHYCAGMAVVGQNNRPQT